MTACLEPGSGRLGKRYQNVVSITTMYEGNVPEASGDSQKDVCRTVVNIRGGITRESTGTALRLE